MRRFIISLLFFSFMLIMPVCADETVIFGTSFENPEDFEAWYGAVMDDASAYDGDFACAVNNCYGQEENGKISHMLSYMRTVSLEEGKIYRLSFSVVNPGAEGSGGQLSSIRFGEGRDNIVFEFDNIADRWTQVEELFVAPKTADYSFSIELKHGLTDVGFLLDDIKIETIDIEPESGTIIGPRELNIPAAGSVSTRYGVGAATSQGEIINLLPEISTIRAENLPAGVSFDENSNTVTVGEGCPDNSAFVLVYTPPEYMALGEVSAEITLTRNMLKNSDFSMADEYWSVDEAYELGSGHMTIFTETPCDYGYMGTVRPTYSLMLMENVMYVLRAYVKVDGGTDSSIYSRNIALSLDGQVTIDILDVSSGSETEVIAAFTPEASGVYDFSVNFVTSEPGAVTVSKMTLAPELPDETYITLHAPGNIALPDTVTSYPFNAYIRDQAGEILSDRCNVRLYPEGKGVELENGSITVSPDAVEGDYEIYAVSRGNSNIEGSLVFTLSHSFIGDGGFEEKSAGQWWAAAAPAALKIEDGDSRFMHITSRENYAVVLNNSYMHLYPGLPYAFRGDVLGERNCVVTAFLEKTDGENIPLVQSELETEQIFELFQTDYELVGRLALYITSADGGEVDLSLDNIELFRSIVSVSALTISGLAESGATLTAQFTFFNNMDDSFDSSACAISWYGMEAGGEPKHMGSGLEFKVPAELVGKYVYFEVTPICAVTGLSGTPLQSVPVSIGEIQYSQSEENEEKPDRTESAVKEKPTLSPVTLSEETDAPFTDMEHWSAEYVLPLYNSGVVNGKTSYEFCPDDKITRAEFAALVCRAFQAKGGSCSFEDVPSGAWYYESVAALNALGIINGTSESAFSPDGFLTREEMTAIIMRVYEAMGLKAEKSSINRFYDHGDISPWAEDYVACGIGVGMVNGTEQSLFLPKKQSTRGEACAMLYRLLKAIDEE